MSINNQDAFAVNTPDQDPQETSEWLESLDAIARVHGRGRAREIMLNLLRRSHELQLNVPMVPTTDYINTIAPENEAEFPGDEKVERTYRAWMRWNAAMLVHRAQRPGIGVGGHISTFASSASLYEVGFNHFFKGQNHPSGGDQIFIQGHASPGPYARAFLEGRLSTQQLDGFRQEKSHAGGGLSSYPHPRLMPDFWQFPTVSMGIGPINAIYQAQFNRYLAGRGFKDTAEQHVWAYLGDGELDEVESRGALQLAANDKLDNLTFVVNANLQRLDGPLARGIVDRAIQPVGMAARRDRRYEAHTDAARLAQGVEDGGRRAVGGIDKTDDHLTRGRCRSGHRRTGAGWRAEHRDK